MARQPYRRRVLKLALPGTAVILIGAITLWPTFIGFLAKTQPHFTPILAKQSQRAALRPLYRATDKDGQTVLIAAEKATEAGKQRYQLRFPKLEYQLHSGQHVLITAKEGFYLTNMKKLEAEGDVHLIHSQGYDFTTPRATIDIASGHIQGTDPIEGTGPTGAMTGKGFDVLEKGNRLVIHHLRMRSR